MIPVDFHSSLVLFSAFSSPLRCHCWDREAPHSRFILARCLLLCALCDLCGASLGSRGSTLALFSCALPSSLRSLHLCGADSSRTARESMPSPGPNDNRNVPTTRKQKLAAEARRARQGKGKQEKSQCGAWRSQRQEPVRRPAIPGNHRGGAEGAEKRK